MLSDEKWYRQYKKIGEVNFLGNIKPQIEHTKTNYIEMVLKYQPVDIRKWQKKINRLKTLKKIIKKEEENKIIRELYSLKIDETIAQCKLIILCRVTKNKVNSKKIEEFNNWQKILYPKPNENKFWWTLKQIRKLYTALCKDNNQKPDRNFLDQLPQKNFKIYNDEKISDKKILNAKKYVLSDLPTKKINSGKLLNAKEIQKYFREYLTILRLTDWQVKIDSTSLSISVDQEKKVIRVPENRKRSEQKIYKLLFHEIGIHVLRKINGEKQRLRLLSSGLNNYKIGEEGLAVFGENYFFNENSYDYHSLMAYISIGLCLGFDGQKRNFQEVYYLLQKIYFAFNKIKNKKNPEEISKKETMIKCIRTFRGTPGDIPGLCLWNDNIYFEGQRKIINLINKNPQELKRVLCGKYDPTNPLHRKALDLFDIE